MVFWSLGTALLAAGAAWGAVRATQKQFKESLVTTQTTVKELNKTVQKIDKAFVSHDQCHVKQGDCLNNHRVWQASVSTQLGELKSLVSLLDQKREDGRFEAISKMYSVRDSKLEKILEKFLEDINMNKPGEKG